MEENLAGICLEELKTSTNPTLILIKFYNKLFNTSFDKSQISVFGKLIKIYGREVVFISILNMYDMEKVDLTKPYGILAYFCKKQIKESTNFIEPVNTLEIQKRINKIKKTKIEVKNPFD